MRFLRNMSENDDRTEERSRAVEKPEGDVEVVGGGEGEAADEEVVPNVVAESPSYTNQAINDMTKDQARKINKNMYPRHFYVISTPGFNSNISRAFYTANLKSWEIIQSTWPYAHVIWRVQLQNILLPPNGARK